MAFGDLYRESQLMLTKFLHMENADDWKQNASALNADDWKQNASTLKTKAINIDSNLAAAVMA
jgi:hypothetical protein